MTGRRRSGASRVAVLALSGAVLLVAAGRPVVFPSADGTMLAADLYEASEQPAPGVVLVHMLGRSKADWAVLAGDLQRTGVTVLAVDLRGHGASGGSASPLQAMTGDVHAAVQWLAGRPGIRPDRIALIGASLGASLALLASVDQPLVRGVALLSPSLDYRGVRIDAGLVGKLGERAVWMAASTEDPYALRSVRELMGAGPGPREQRLSAVRAHGTTLLAQDPVLKGELVDWLRRTLIF